MKNINQYSHKTNESYIDNFYKIMSGEKKLITKRDEEEFEASYFAMCILLPKEAFLQMIDFLGGMESVKSNTNSKKCLARVFNVEYRLVETRINDLLSQEKQQEKDKSRNKKRKK